jgi:hypothetical protein
MSGGARGEEKSHEYQIPGHGKLLLKAPEGWKESSESLKDPASASIRFEPPTGDAFYIQITSVWLDADKLAASTPEVLKMTVARSADEPLTHAGEKKAVLQELRGSQSRGYYFSLTDRDPPADEYKYVTQGALLTGELMTVFTILYREPSPPVLSLALKMLGDAGYSAK